METQTQTYQSVAVIGAGLMGHGIAQIFALSGRHVWLNDLEEDMLSEALVNIQKNLKIFVENGLVAPEEVSPALARIKTTTSLEQAAGPADYVVEAVSENLALKQSIFTKLDNFSIYF